MIVRPYVPFHSVRHTPTNPGDRRARALVAGGVFCYCDTSDTPLSNTRYMYKPRYLLRLTHRISQSSTRSKLAVASPVILPYVLRHNHVRRRSTRTARPLHHLGWALLLRILVFTSLLQIDTPATGPGPRRHLTFSPQARRPLPLCPNTRHSRIFSHAKVASLSKRSLPSLCSDREERTEACVRLMEISHAVTISP